MWFERPEDGLADGESLGTWGEVRRVDVVDGLAGLVVDAFTGGASVPRWDVGVGLGRISIRVRRGLWLGTASATARAAS
jgi:hypothetical protein